MTYKRVKLFTAEWVKSLRRSGIPALQNIRYWNRWNGYMEPGRNSMDDQQPWLTFTAIDYIKDKISREDKVFEYGGGGSTLFFLNHALSTVTVEHDEKWFSLLKERILLKKYENWTGIHEPATDIGSGAGLDIANPADYYSDDENFKNCNFRNYALAINAYPDEFFDWVIVDGRARPSCIVQALNKIKPKGYLILDNSDREYYLRNTKQLILNRFKPVLNRMAPAPYLPWFSETSIWNKQ